MFCNCSAWSRWSHPQPLRHWRCGMRKPKSCAPLSDFHGARSEVRGPGTVRGGLGQRPKGTGISGGAKGSSTHHGDIHRDQTAHRQLALGGCPFLPASGKRLASASRKFQFSSGVASLLFRGAVMEGIEPNLLSLRIQPNEGISLKFSAKSPGTTMHIRPCRWTSAMGNVWRHAPTAYETLLLDCMLGDSTLFNRDDAVESACISSILFCAVQQEASRAHFL